MSLPVRRTYAPMEARLVDELPVGPGWQYEPKWDGFRCLAFKDGDRVDIMSKAGKPLARYFPDVVELLRAIDAPRFVLDGEIVIPFDGSLSFDELLLRIHPAKSRVEKLAREHPAALVVFDLLVDANGDSLVKLPLRDRRARLEVFVAEHVAPGARVWLSPATTAMATVKQWFRYASKKKVVGSLLLGLYDGAGLLHHVGFTSSIKAADKAALTKKLEGLIKPPGFTGQAPGAPSRWSTARSAQWQPLAPKLVVEVQYDHFDGGRFRHGTGFLRWRPDKEPRQCTWDSVLPRRREGDPTVQTLLEA
jgi:ATP-dependent DNA ligase